MSGKKFVLIFLGAIGVYFIVSRAFRQDPVPQVSDNQNFTEIRVLLKNKDLPKKERELLSAFNEYVDSQKKKDADKAMEYMLPQLIKIKGGQKKLKEEMLKTLAHYENLSVKVGEYHIFSDSHSDKVVASINTETYVTIKDDKIDYKLIYQVYGYSEDGGYKWFILEPTTENKDFLVAKAPEPTKKVKYFQAVKYHKNENGEWEYQAEESNLMLDIVSFFK